MKMQFSAGGVVYRRIDNKVEFALILNHDQKWTFAKGHIEKGEKPEVAAVREVGEEIGVKDLTAQNLLEKIDYWFIQDGEKIHKFVYFYLMAAPNDATLQPQLDEVGDARWFAADDVTDNLYYHEDLRLFQKALDCGIINP